MGAVDYLPGGGQTKCWKCENKIIDVGKKVGKLDKEKNYIVLLREGGYVLVLKGKIASIAKTDQKCDDISFFDPLPVFDKYGNRIQDIENYKGLFGYDYYF